MSLCDTCHTPGNCCRRIFLSGSDGKPLTLWNDEDPKAQLAARSSEPLPFEPLETVATFAVAFGEPEAGRLYSTWAWSCPALGADGRCTIYDHRPQVCRNYEPASDGLCVYYRADGDGAAA